VVRVGDEIIIGFDEARLQQLLGLIDTSTALSNEWLAAKYELVFDSLVRAVRALGPTGLATPFTQRRMSVRAHVLHIAAFAEGGYLANERGKFDTDDMFAATDRANQMTEVDEICAYVATVRDDIASFLTGAFDERLERVVTSHYGGQVSVVELMRIMLRHSTHHLLQLYWFMENELHIRSPAAPTTDDLAGITTPKGLFDV
jgi:uncharacterized damage-inducible protein DinB